MKKDFFAVKAKFRTISEDGKQVKRKQLFLIDAVTFGEAETRMFGMLKETSEIYIASIARVKCDEFLQYQEGDAWYQAKVISIFTSPRGKERKHAYRYILNATNTAEANSRIKEFLKGSIAGYKINSISETSYTEVYIHDEKKEADEAK